eukprot:TRINITY_DN2322_c2_g1_i6.p1 TRINITY_DN2322_c2_g1~~TRINITY_DN2322_c2_g1_i6.p1  ORF type:complete len:652 (-),score=145.94 TRINITY_DN2322_c2_g1_i6:275-2230(-)
MPPLPIIVRAVLTGTLKGSPVQIQYLTAGGVGGSANAVPSISARSFPALKHDLYLDAAADIETAGSHRTSGAAGLMSQSKEVEHSTILHEQQQQSNNSNSSNRQASHGNDHTAAVSVEVAEKMKNPNQQRQQSREEILNSVKENGKDHHSPLSFIEQQQQQQQQQQEEGEKAGSAGQFEHEEKALAKLQLEHDLQASGLSASMSLGGALSAMFQTAATAESLHAPSEKDLTAPLRKMNISDTSNDSASGRADRMEPLRSQGKFQIDKLMPKETKNKEALRNPGFTELENVSSVVAGIKAVAAILCVAILFLFGLACGKIENDKLQEKSKWPPAASKPGTKKASLLSFFNGENQILDLQSRESAASDQQRQLQTGGSSTKQPEQPAVPVPVPVAVPTCGPQNYFSDAVEAKKSQFLSTSQFASPPTACLPSVCPPYMRATEGAELILKLGCPGQLNWSSEVAGLCASADATRRGPPPRLLSVTVTGSGLERVLQVKEQSPGGTGLSHGGAAATLMTVDSSMKIWLNNVGGDRRCFSSFARLSMGVAGRRIYSFCAEGLDSETPLFAVSCGASGSQMELGVMPSGQLLASSSKDQASSGIDEAAEDVFRVSVKPGVDAAVALSFILAVAIFAPPEGPELDSRRSKSSLLPGLA